MKNKLTLSTVLSYIKYLSIKVIGKTQFIKLSSVIFRFLNQTGCAKKETGLETRSCSKGKPIFVSCDHFSIYTSLVKPPSCFYKVPKFCLIRFVCFLYSQLGHTHHLITPSPSLGC